MTVSLPVKAVAGQERGERKHMALTRKETEKASERRKRNWDDDRPSTDCLGELSSSCVTFYRFTIKRHRGAQWFPRSAITNIRNAAGWRSRGPHGALAGERGLELLKRSLSSSGFQ